MSHPTHSIRHRITLGLAAMIIVPLSTAVQILNPHPSQKWLRRYGKAFDWIAGGVAKLHLIDDDPPHPAKADSNEDQ